ncbi:MAG TPA: proton-conducting transporter membrane subunit, partial [Candidatus Dormibacteraeota bacterium]|nr:proton-conducting transporter membrane subunit [Candidatus Dormibacteraeota bacterium]
MIALAVAVAALPLSGSLAALLTPRAGPVGRAAIGGGVLALAGAILLAAHVLGGPPVRALHDFVYVDGLGGFFLVTVAAVVCLASLGSAPYLQAAEERGTMGPLQVRAYFVFFGLFAAAMLGAVETGNLGLLFVLVEASTLASVVLVALEGRAAALEAGWKYVIISALGITIALVGTLFVYYAATALPGTPDQHLTWAFLVRHAAQLRVTSLRLGFLLVVVGYGTKVGLAPMHTWLPDAHAEAPGPASAMLSGALLNVGMYALIRFLAIANRGLGSAYGSHVLLVFGFLSTVVGALFIVRRGDFKRLFAYS